MKALLTALSSLLMVLYPLIIFIGLSHFEPRTLALFLSAVLVLRFLAIGRGKELLSIKSAFTFIVIGVGLVGFTVANNSTGGLKLYPVIINFSLLTTFLLSLHFPPSAIERIARFKEPNLPEAGVVYTRKVTKVWCGFFLFNGIIALYTSLYSSVEHWAIYNGLISYVLVACLFLGELFYRTIYVKPKPK